MCVCVWARSLPQLILAVYYDFRAEKERQDLKKEKKKKKKGKRGSVSEQGPQQGRETTFHSSS